LLTLGSGLFLWLKFKNTKEKFRIREGILVVLGRLSNSEITVAPVVLRPDIDSKNASLKDICKASESKNGMVANNESTNQKLTTTKIPLINLLTTNFYAI
jgi:UDP-N-acetylmuramyl tripeptide synthase